MMKRIHQIGALVAMLCIAGGASAQTIPATKTVNLRVNFTATCQLATGSTGALAVNFGNYTAFAADKVVNPTNITLECTRGYSLTPTLAWDGTDTVNNTGDATTVAKANGVMAGLRYQLQATPGASDAGLAPVLTVGSETNGTPLTYTVGIGGTLFSGAGTGLSGVQTDSRILTLTF